MRARWKVGELGREDSSYDGVGMATVRGVMLLCRRERGDGGAAVTIDGAIQ